jgi:hypothetical protein
MTDLAPYQNLNAPGLRKIAEQILADIDEYCVKTYFEGHRNHLGASLIGKECAWYLWGVFRWLKAESHGGRMQRLFRRGHREEAQFIEMLRGIGFQIWEVADDGNQHRVKACGGHFGGSLDGIGRPPAKYRIGEPLLLEFKTQGTGKGFEYLLKHGVKLAKPDHYAQMSIYGRHYGFRNALYLAVNKNDDSLHIEIVELDWKEAEVNEKKADKIILSQFPPAKIAESPAYVGCMNCALKGQCHEGLPPEVNCRSCRNATPVIDSQWYCGVHRAVIPKEVIKAGCPNWDSII